MRWAIFIEYKSAASVLIEGIERSEQRCSAFYAGAAMRQDYL